MNKKAELGFYTIIGLILVLLTAGIITMLFLNISDYSKDQSNELVCGLDVAKIVSEQRLLKDKITVERVPRCSPDIKYVKKIVPTQTYEEVFLSELDKELNQCNFTFSPLQKSYYNYICAYLYLDQDLDKTKLQEAYENNKDELDFVNETEVALLIDDIDQGILKKDSPLIVTFEYNINTFIGIRFPQKESNLGVFHGIDRFVEYRLQQSKDKSRLKYVG